MRELSFDGLVTLERALLLGRRSWTVARCARTTKLTVYVGRQERVAGAPAYEAVVELLHARGVAGATVLLGVDGTAHGVRRRARFFGRNADVPLMVIAVGDGARIAAVAPGARRAARTTADDARARSASASATAGCSPRRVHCRRPTRPGSASGRS